MKKTINILLLLLLCFTTYGQDVNLTDSQTEQKSDVIKLSFDHNSYVIDLDVSQNREALIQLSNLVERLASDTLSTISKVEINSYASPEGGRSFNTKLTKLRSNSIYEYLTAVTCIPDSLIDKRYSGSDWQGLEDMVKVSDVPYKDDVLDILRNVPEETWKRVNPNHKWLTLVDSRNKHLMELKYGVPYNYMFDNIFPALRNGSVVTVYFERKELPVIENKEAVVIAEKLETESEQIVDAEPAPIVEIKTEAESVIKPLFALKTNLLFDFATLLNIEFEIPIGKRWSIACEWVFPWWTFDNGKSDSRRSRIQLLNGNIEGKYWFGDRTNRPVMTGWFAGLYAGGGLYDFERNGKGYQGEFFIAAGIGGGYAHTINKSGTLRMEYSVGIGYLETNYRYYEAQFDIDNKWHPIRQQNGTYTWIGPTQAKVSLVWLLNFRSKKGGER